MIGRGKSNFWRQFKPVANQGGTLRLDNVEQKRMALLHNRSIAADGRFRKSARQFAELEIVRLEAELLAIGRGE